jgi:hypothetical protein
MIYFLLFDLLYAISEIPDTSDSASELPVTTDISNLTNVFPALH